MLCAGQTTDPGSVVSGRFLLYAATFVEDDREVVSSPSAGRRWQRCLWSLSESLTDDAAEESQEKLLHNSSNILSQLK